MANKNPKKRGPATKLNARQRIMIEHWFDGGCKSKVAACRAAGYAHAVGYVHRLFTNPLVVAEINRRWAKMRKKYDLNEDWVIQRLMRIADSGDLLAPYKKVNEAGELYWDFEGIDEDPDAMAVIQSMTVETYVEGRGKEARTVKKFRVEAAEPKGALDSLCRRLGLFNDKMNVSGELNVVELLQQGRKRLGKPAGTDAALETDHSDEDGSDEDA